MTGEGAVAFILAAILLFLLEVGAGLIGSSGVPDLCQLLLGCSCNHLLAVTHFYLMTSREPGVWSSSSF